jgi:hypothetical protein
VIVAEIEFTEERRRQIIALLGVLYAGLPEPTRRDESVPGFVNEIRERECPDCLANGRVTFACETCRGSGRVSSASPRISAADELDTDGQRIDPYAQHDWLSQPYGVGGTRKIGHVSERDHVIDRLNEQTREPFQSFEDELAAANRAPYPWERERESLRRRYSLDALRVALDDLRASPEPGLAGLVVAVYAREPGESLVEPSATLEAGVDRALRFLSGHMPEELRAPGDDKHPALSRRDRRAA